MVSEATPNMTVIVIPPSLWSSALMIASNGKDFEQTGEVRAHARDTSNLTVSDGAW